MYQLVLSSHLYPKGGIYPETKAFLLNQIGCSHGGVDKVLSEISDIVQ